MASIAIHPDSKALLEANGLASFEALYAAGDAGLVDGHQERSVSRVELRAASGEPVVIYLKRRWGRAAGRSWTDLLRLKWPACATAREWSNIQRLAAAGIPVAEPVAWGRAAGPEGKRTLLAVREVRGLSLASWLDRLTSGGAEPGPHSVAQVAAAVGKAVRRLHDAGYSFPDLYAKHVFLEDAGGEAPRVVLIDVSRLRRYTPRRGAADLAALHATTQVPPVRKEDRLLVLRAYLGRGAAEGDLERLARRVKSRRAGTRRIAGRGRDPHLIPARRVAPSGMVPLAEERFSTVDGGRLRMNEAFRPALQAAGLSTLDALMAFEGGETYRVGPGRRTVRAELADPAGTARILYIKRHDRVPWRTRIRRMIGLGDPISLAEHEARNLVRLMDAGIPTVRCAAVGWEFTNGGRGERSCLVTEELAGAVQADVYCERQFGSARRGGGKTAARRRWIRALGRLARQFHASGFVHRDFYLCHVLVRPVGADDFVLHLIDLQRMMRFRGGVPASPRGAPASPRGAPGRWIVKDLAALVFSSWPSPATFVRSEVFTNTDRMRFAREYFGTDRLSAAQKALVRRAVRKARRIDLHERRRSRPQ
ncbi:MAG: lipopolysaccharide kinase InaA family protein [Phycisphaerae bacterium]